MIRAARDFFVGKFKVDTTLREQSFTTFEHKVIIKNETVANLMTADLKRIIIKLNDYIAAHPKGGGRRPINWNERDVKKYIRSKFKDDFCGGENGDNFKRWYNTLNKQGGGSKGPRLAVDKWGVSFKRLAKGKNFAAKATGTQLTVHLHQGIIGFKKDYVDGGSFNIVLGTFRRMYDKTLWPIVYNEMISKLPSDIDLTAKDYVPLNQYLVINAHGVIGADDKPKGSVTGGQTTMAGLEVFSTYLKFKEWLAAEYPKKADKVRADKTFGANFAEDSIDQLLTIYEDAIASTWSIDKFLDDKKEELKDSLLFTIELVERSKNPAMSFYDMKAVKKRMLLVYKAAILKAAREGKADWATMKGSDSRVDRSRNIVQTQLINELLKVKGTRPDFRLKLNKKLLKKAKSSRTSINGPNAGAVKKNAVVLSKATMKAAGAKIRNKGARGQGKVAQSPIALRNILNEMLPMTVAKNMGSPALNFRTGRFANSARVEMIHQGPKGGMAVDYTYMKEPYQTFEPGYKQGSTQRDPRKIIGESIRELATGILGRQPHTVRRT